VPGRPGHRALITIKTLAKRDDVGIVEVFEAARRGPEAAEATHDGRSLTTRADQLIYVELDPPSEVYLLTRGWVQLFVGDGKQRQTSLFLRAPALFGDRDVIAGCAITHESARSVSSANLLCFSRESLEEAYAADRDFADALHRDLVVRYARSLTFSSFRAMNLENRVLWILWELGSTTLPTYETLALLTDASQKSVGRAVKALQDDGRLELRAERQLVVSQQTWDELGAPESLGLFHSIGH
jgi:CRP-like cAMP-binding protein